MEGERLKVLLQGFILQIMKLSMVGAPGYGCVLFSCKELLLHTVKRSIITSSSRVASFPVPRPAFRRLQYGKLYRTANDEKLGVGLGTRLVRVCRITNVIHNSAVFLH